MDRLDWIYLPTNISGYHYKQTCLRVSMNDEKQNQICHI